MPIVAAVILVGGGLGWVSLPGGHESAGRAPAGEVEGAVATPAEAGVVRSRSVALAANAGGPWRDDPAQLAPQPPDPATLSGYVWPLAHARITLPFKAIPGGEWSYRGRLWHDGIDLATFCGDRVTAAHAGRVIAAGRHFDDVIGWVGDLRPYYALLDRKKMWSDLPIVVVIDDGNGYRSIYAHFSRVVVAVGAAVQAGDLLGYEGATGHASGCHLHYGLFSPLETVTFGVRPDILKALDVPALEIARIDPLLVLPDGAYARLIGRVPPLTTAGSPIVPLPLPAAPAGSGAR